MNMVKPKKSGAALVYRQDIDPALAQCPVFAVTRPLGDILRRGLFIRARHTFVAPQV